MAATTQSLRQQPSDRTTCYAMIRGPQLRPVRPLITPKRGPARNGTRIDIPLPTRKAHCERCGTLDRICDACGRGNLTSQSFCGFCGESLPPTAAELLHAQQDTNVTTNNEPVTNASGAPKMLPAEVEATSPGGGTVVATPSSLRGLSVVLLGTPEDGTRTHGETTYLLDVGEPFDVSGPHLAEPGSFTAMTNGLRFDAAGDLGEVFVRVGSRVRAMAGRNVRVERDLGTFQSVARGETLPIGSLAIIGTALVRIDAA